MSSSPKSARLGFAALVFAAALVPFACLVWRFDWLCDDAYISFRYARNLAEGFGLRFNRGPGTPVEGYSNFLWVLVLSIVERTGSDVTLWARLMSALSGLVLVGWLVRTLIARFPSRPASVLAAALFLGTFPPLAVWSTGGLATMPFTLCLFGAYERLARERPRALQAGLFAAAAVLLRADGAPWVLLALATAFLGTPRDRRAAWTRSALLTLGIAAATALAHLLWRKGYYDSWSPNTAKVKADLGELLTNGETRALYLERGLAYVVSFLLSFPSLAVLLVLSGAASLRRADEEELRPWPLALPLLGAFAYSLLVGGDFMAMGRFLIPALPFTMLFFAASLARLGPSRNMVTGIAAVSLAAISLLPTWNLHPVPRALRERFHFRWNEKDHVKTEYEMWDFMRRNAANWTVLGKALAQHTEPGESMTQGPIGAVGYYTDLVLYDSYGLTNRELAELDTPRKRASAGHDKLVPTDFFDSYRPTYFGATILGRDEPLSGPLADPRFMANKRIERIPLDPGRGFPPNADLVLIRYVW